MALAVASWVWAATAIAAEPGSTRPAVAGWVVGAVLGGLQLARRRSPVGVLAASAAIVVGYHAAGYAGIGTAWPLVLPYLTAAAAGHLLPAAVLALALAAGSAGWRLLVEQEAVVPVLAGAGQDLGVAALALAVGEVLWQRHRWAEEAAARLTATEDAARQQARQALTAQRLAIAADLHDVAGHSLVRIGLHLRVAEEFVDSDPAACRRSLAAASAAHEEAMAETTATVRLLHGEHAPGGAPRAPGPGLGRLAELRTVAADAGVTLRLDLPDGLDDQVPAAVGLVAYRICQEALTNTLRHSTSPRAQLTVRRDGDALRLCFRDSGPARTTGGAGAGRPSGGHGIAGMRTRAASVGGAVDAGPCEGGYRVEAWLPLPAPATAW